MIWVRGWRLGASLLLAAAWAVTPSSTRADVYLTDMWDEGLVPPGTMVFPNWAKVWAGSFVVELCEGCVDPDPTDTVQGVTVVNFGSATSADIASVYWVLGCNGSIQATYAMTYAGVYDEDTGAYPAWTWGGTTINVGKCNPLCVGCTAASFEMHLYVDVAPCPAEGVSINLGFPFHGLTNTTCGGSVSDNHCSPATGDQCTLPWDDLPGGDMHIVHILKDADKDTAAPGDTLTYTIYYGRQGTSITQIEVFDTIPPYTHYIAGSGAPAPDPTWGTPNIGPPQTLRWVIPGPLPVAGGPTGEVTFSVSLDWGNGESFEPGSGDVGAPEGPGLNNSASAVYTGVGCPVTAWGASTGLTVRRYLFWKLGDNDVVFAGRLGQPDDEMVYSIFAKNVSTKKTWWNVHIWDTVPPEMEVWTPDGYGFEDPCVGWTMTPTGCAAASPGVKVVAGKTILTWALDLPPQMTVELRWKARVSQAAKAFSTAINQASIQAWGASGIVDGTGNSIKPKVFTHLAPVVLRTTYLSYVGTGSANDNWNECDPFIVFYPLNKATDFEFRGIEYVGPTGWAADGGVSASIGPLIGTCSGGLFCPGSTGCGVERAPTHYSRWNAPCLPNSGVTDPCPGFPFHFIYKLVSNSPVLWQVFSLAETQFDDGHTFTPSNSLSFSGFMHYTFLRENQTDDVVSDALNIMNTSIDAYNVYRSNLDTTVLVFKWNTAARGWDFWDIYEVDPDSQVMKPPVDTGEGGYYRIVSSQTKLVVHQWAKGGALVMNHLMPNRETGATSSKPGAGYTFYVFPGWETDYQSQVGVTNLGATTATYRIEWYKPRKSFPAPPNVPPWMADTSGTWLAGPTDTVLPGLAVGVIPNGNPHGYGPPYDPAFSFKTPDNTWGIWRIVQLSGGPIQVVAGEHFMSWFGGSVVHASNGDQTGQEFWVSQYQSCTYKAGCPDNYALYAVDVFCPKTNMAVRAVSSDGYSATYTSNGPDQCIMFSDFTDMANGARRNIRINLLGTGSQGNLLCQHINCADHQRMFCAPFMVVGTHYEIIGPPVAFLGTSAWITVVVVDAAGTTKDDYCGTTSFTSTDPGAKIDGGAMDLFNYTWKSSTPPCVACGGGVRQRGTDLPQRQLHEAGPADDRGQRHHGWIDHGSALDHGRGRGSQALQGAAVHDGGVLGYGGLQGLLEQLLLRVGIHDRSHGRGAEGDDLRARGVGQRVRLWKHGRRDARSGLLDGHDRGPAPGAVVHHGQSGGGHAVAQVDGSDGGGEHHGLRLLPRQDRLTVRLVS